MPNDMVSDMWTACLDGVEKFGSSTESVGKKTIYTTEA
jgi:hypothetical protein